MPIPTALEMEQACSRFHAAVVHGRLTHDENVLGLPPIPEVRE